MLELYRSFLHLSWCLLQAKHKEAEALQTSIFLSLSMEQSLIKRILFWLLIAYDFELLLVEKQTQEFRRKRSHPRSASTFPHKMVSIASTRTAETSSPKTPQAAPNFCFLYLLRNAEKREKISALHGIVTLYKEIVFM